MKNSLFLVLFLFVSACSSVRVYKDVKSAQTGPEITYTNHTYLFGFLGGKEVHPDELCKGPWNSMRISMRAREIAYTAATLGIYVPQQVKVECQTSVAN